MIARLLLLLHIAVNTVWSQINLGTFSLHPQGPGGFDLGLSQGANILGFGGDRGFRLNGRPNNLGIQSTGGALVGGERVGVDSGFGLGQSGLDLGSQLQFGNQPQPMHPMGQFGAFLDNIKNFFSRLVPPGLPPMPQPAFTPAMLTTIPPTLRPHINTEGAGGSDFSSEGWTDEEMVPMEGETGKESKTQEWKGGVAVGENRDGETEEIRAKRPEIDEIRARRPVVVTGHERSSSEKPRQLPGLIEMH